MNIVGSKLFLLALVFGGIAFADEPIGTNTINNQDLGLYVLGDQQHHKVVSDLELKGGKAIEVEVTGVGGPWQAGATSLIIGNIRRGDRISVKGYLRSTTASGLPGKIIIRVETATEPWATIYEQEVKVDKYWQLISASFVAERHMKPNSTQVTLHLNKEKQKVYLGPIIVLNEGNQKKK